MRILLFIALTWASAHGQDRDFWLREGQKTVHDAVKRRHNTGVAKNIVLLVGDGMDVPTYTAARILKGQMEGGKGVDYQLEFEKFPYTGLVKTYSLDLPVADSAATASAFLSGVKTRDGVLGVDERVIWKDCSKVQEASVETIVDWALREGKSVGLVTTAHVTDATPAAGFAKTPNRKWECDADMKNLVGCDHVKDIASQLVEKYDGIQVVLGGGRNKFLTTSNGGEREDRDLVELWKETQRNKGAKYQYVENADELKMIPDDTEYLLGLFAPSDMAYDVQRKEAGEDSQPHIADMLEKAIKILSRNDKGYFLLVEGARIDHAHHQNLAHLALLDTIAFDKAVQKAVSMTSESDTLMMVTADHAHVMSIGGYPLMGRSIVDKIANQYDSNGKPMTILMYTNGPGPQQPDLTNIDTTVTDFVFPSAVHLVDDTHGGQDVAVFARGPMSHLVTGVQEQNVLALIMGYASCLGPDKNHCEANTAGLTLFGSRKILTAGILITITSTYWL